MTYCMTCMASHTDFPYVKDEFAHVLTIKACSSLNSVFLLCIFDQGDILMQNALTLFVR